MGKPSFLIHYASEYYDPVKAHEYYMQHRHLVGRKGTLNDKGTAAKNYVKQQIDSERDSKLAAEDSSRESQLNSAKTNRDNTVKNVKETSTKALEAAKTERYNNIMNHTTKALNEIKTLREEIHGGNLTEAQIKTNLQKIYSLREGNEKKRQEVEEAFNKKSATIASDYETGMNDANNNYSSQTSSIRSTSQANKANIRQEAKDKYEKELDQIYANPEFIKQKTSSGKGKKDKGTSRAESLQRAWDSYNARNRNK